MNGLADKSRKDELLKAIDTVCENCWGRENDCNDCRVRYIGDLANGPTRKFTVIVRETLEEEVEIEAGSENAALDIAAAMHRNGEVEVCLVTGNDYEIKEASDCVS